MLRRSLRSGSIMLALFVLAMLPVLHCSGGGPTAPEDPSAATAAGAGNTTAAVGDGGDASSPGGSDPGSDPGGDPGATEVAGLSLEKSTNGFDADDPPGPTIPVGDPVSWGYVVTNTGDVALTGVVVTDDQGVAVSCPTDTLAPGETMTCTGDGTAEPGQYANIGRAEAPDPENPGAVVFATDPSHYLGEEAPAGAAIDIEKSTNGVDADDPPGPTIPAGDPVLWEYVVTNTGDVTLVDVVVSDDQGVAVSCPTDVLDPAETMTCSAQGTAEVGPYANIGRAEAPDPANPGSTVFDTDPSHYLGEEVLDCSQAVPSSDVLWPPNHKMENVSVEGVGSTVGTVSITIDSIFQDEPVNGTGDGDTWPDGSGVGTDTASLRAERAGGADGRFYHLAFTADNGAGSTCTGEVLVTVPKSQGHAAVDQGPLYDSTASP